MRDKLQTSIGLQRASPVAAGLQPARVRPRLDIGLVNNMPDGAIAATERQFTSLLRAGSPDYDVHVHLIALPGVPRSAFTTSQMQGRYLDFDRLASTPLDV